MMLHRRELGEYNDDDGGKGGKNSAKGGWEARTSRATETVFAQVSRFVILIDLRCNESQCHFATPEWSWPGLAPLLRLLRRWLY